MADKTPKQEIKAKRQAALNAVFQEYRRPQYDTSGVLKFIEDKKKRELEARQRPGFGQRDMPNITNHEDSDDRTPVQNVSQTNQTDQTTT
jgi:hypothetical protein